MQKFPLKVQVIGKALCLSSIFLAGVFSYSSVSYANVNGIPYNPDFPNAQHPFAQAPDGCSGWQDRRQIRDTWGPVKFTEACNNHDRCYYTRGSSWNTCNENFFSELKAACNRDLRIGIFNPITKKTTYTPPESNSLKACLIVASKYYDGVQAGVLLDVFEEAQGKQRRYEEWVASIRKPTSSSNQLAEGIYFDPAWGVHIYVWPSPFEAGTWAWCNSPSPEVTKALLQRHSLIGNRSKEEIEAAGAKYWSQACGPDM